MESTVIQSFAVAGIQLLLERSRQFGRAYSVAIAVRGRLLWSNPGWCSRLIIWTNHSCGFDSANLESLSYQLFLSFFLCFFCAVCMLKTT